MTVPSSSPSPNLLLPSPPSHPPPCDSRIYLVTALFRTGSTQRTLVTNEVATRGRHTRAVSSSAGDSGKRIEDAVVTLRAKVGSEGPVINYEEGAGRNGNIGPGPKFVAPPPPQDMVKHFKSVGTFYAPPPNFIRQTRSCRTKLSPTSKLCRVKHFQPPLFVGV